MKPGLARTAGGDGPVAVVGVAVDLVEAVEAADATRRTAKSGFLWASRGAHLPAGRPQFVVLPARQNDRDVITFSAGGSGFITLRGRSDSLRCRYTGAGWPERLRQRNESSQFVSPVAYHAFPRAPGHSPHCFRIGRAGERNGAAQRGYRKPQVR